MENNSKTPFERRANIQSVTLNHNAESSLEMISQGKVRNIYEPTGLFFEISDRLSVFDRVIAEHVPFKGKMLNCISQENKKFLEAHNIDTDYIPSRRLLFKVWGLDPGRCSYSKKLDMFPFEFIVRGYLTGSAWKAYKSGKSYCGFTFPKGMNDGQKLKKPIVTPTTKESTGHDKPVTQSEAIELLAYWILEKQISPSKDMLKSIYSPNSEELKNSISLSIEAREFASPFSENIWKELEVAIAYETAVHFINTIYQKSLEIFNLLTSKYEENGVLLIDTKFEFGLDNENVITLGDEVGTPDSSRYAPKDIYEKTRKIVSLDKQIVRDYCTSIGFTGEETQDIPEIPNSIWEQVTHTYIDIATQLFGKDVVKMYM